MNTILKSDNGLIAKIWLITLYYRNLFAYWWCNVFGFILLMMGVKPIETDAILGYLATYVHICKQNGLDPWGTRYSLICNAIDLRYEDIVYVKDYHTHIRNKLVVHDDVVGKVLL